MSRTDFLPAGDAHLADFGRAFVANLAADPLGLSPAEVAEVTDAVDAYRAAFAVAFDPATRTVPHVASKNAARTTCRVAIRAAARQIRANPAVTDPQLIDLGLRPRRASYLTPTPAPSTRPSLVIQSTGRLCHTILVRDESSLALARPPRLAGAEIFMTPLPNNDPAAPLPGDLRDWQYLGLATRPEFLVTHRTRDAFSRVAICARWLNAKGQSGAPSFPVYARVAA